MVEAEARAGPVERDEGAGAGERGVGGAEVGAAEADVGDERVGQRDVLDGLAVGADGGDAAVDQRADAHPALAVHGQAVEQLEPGQAGEQLAAVADRAGAGDLARAGQVPREHPAGVGLGGVERACRRATGRCRWARRAGR